MPKYIKVCLVVISSGMAFIFLNKSSAFHSGGADVSDTIIVNPTKTSREIDGLTKGNNVRDSQNKVREGYLTENDKASLRSLDNDVVNKLLDQIDRDHELSVSALSGETLRSLLAAGLEIPKDEILRSANVMKLSDSNKAIFTEIYKKLNQDIVELGIAKMDAFSSLSRSKEGVELLYQAAAESPARARSIVDKYLKVTALADLDLNSIPLGEGIYELDHFDALGNEAFLNHLTASLSQDATSNVRTYSDNLIMVRREQAIIHKLGQYTVERNLSDEQRNALADFLFDNPEASQGDINKILNEN